MSELDDFCRRALPVALALLMQTTLLLSAGLLLGVLLRRRGPAVAALIQRATLAALVVSLAASLGGASRLPTLWRVSLPSAPRAAPALRTAPPVFLPILPPRPAPRPAPEQNVASPGEDAVPSPPKMASATRPTAGAFAWQTVALGVWAGGALAGLLWLAVSHWLLRRLRRGSHAITDPRAADALRDLSNALGVRPPQLRAHPGVQSPFLAGVRRGVIFLPATWAEDFDALALRAVLAHELAHVARRDPAWNLLARLLGALLWPQPQLVLLRRQRERTAEEVCDLAVLQLSACPPRAYADCLLRLAERGCVPRLAVGIVPFRSSLARRVALILSKENSAMTPLSPRARLCAALGAACLVAVSLCLVSVTGAQTPTPSAPTEVVSQYLKLRRAGRGPEGFALVAPKEAHGFSMMRPPDSRQPLIEALAGFFAVPNQATWRNFWPDFHVIGPAPNDANTVLVSYSYGEHKPNVMLRVATVMTNGVWRIDMNKTFLQTDAGLYQRLVVRNVQFECLDHQRTIMLAMIMYAQEHGERLPRAAHWMDDLKPYVIDESIYRDPAAPAGQKYGYAFNRALSGARFANIAAPAQAVVLLESVQNVRNASDSGQSLPRPGRHSGGSDFGFADGHVKYFRDAARPPLTPVFTPLRAPRRIQRLTPAEIKALYVDQVPRMKQGIKLRGAWSWVDFDSSPASVRLQALQAELARTKAELARVRAELAQSRASGSLNQNGGASQAEQMEAMRAVERAILVARARQLSASRQEQTARMQNARAAQARQAEMLKAQMEQMRAQRKAYRLKLKLMEDAARKAKEPK